MFSKRLEELTQVVAIDDPNQEAGRIPFRRIRERFGVNVGTLSMRLLIEKLDSEGRKCLVHPCHADTVGPP